MSKKDIESRTEELLLPIAERAGVHIYDVEYVKEGSDWYLRAFIDKDGGVDIVDCENVSRELSAELDRYDYIAEAYILEVSSPGLGRTLRRERHFINSMGEEVEIKTYKAIDGQKEFVGILKEYNNGDVTIESDGEQRIFPKADIASVRLTFDF